MRTLMMITIVALMTATMAKSDEKTITPQEFGNVIAETPAKLVNFISGEVEKTKEYQKKSWAEMKTKWPWTMFNKKKD
tara:strand:- start:176 stop:409 length:234 start_codon:yes stop_codon:yes gene_type:complete